MLNNPLISIIIPCYNAEKYIKECIESITSQKFQNFEILCLDDCSSDNTLQILENMSSLDERIKVFPSTQKMYAGALRNKGIKIANGEWLLFCDSDDWLEENILQDLSEVISKLDKNINIVEYNFNISVDKIQKKQADWLNRGETGIKQVKNIDIMLATGNGNKLYRKSFIDCYNLKNCENNMSGEEIPMHICSYLLAGKIFYLNKIGYNWRQNLNSTSRSKNNTKFLQGVFIMTNFLKEEMCRLNIYDEKYYHIFCKTIYNWHIKEKQDLSVPYFKYYMECNKKFANWGLKCNKPLLFVVIKLMFKNMIKVVKYDKRK